MVTPYLTPAVLHFWPEWSTQRHEWTRTQVPNLAYNVQSANLGQCSDLTHSFTKFAAIAEA